MKNVVVLGKGALAVKACDWLEKSPDYKLLAVVADMPEPTWTDSISEWAIKNEVALVTTGKYKDLSEALNIDLAISIVYGKIIKQDFIDRCGDVINLHNSPLPKYRGVRPINWALKNNLTHTWGKLQLMMQLKVVILGPKSGSAWCTVL